MPPKPIILNTSKHSGTKNSTHHSRVIDRRDLLEGGEETEIAAQITIPQEGGWGWVVVIASFFCIFALDGVSFTFGALLQDIANDLQVSDSIVALINSSQLAMYFMFSPFASALINRFGFRACALTGSVISSVSLFISYFAKNYGTLLVTYGLCSGIGFALINMAASLIVGFYFEKRRAIALGLSTNGSNVGIMALSPLNVFLVKLAGWRSVTLLHSGFFGLVFFLSMAFRPLLSLTVVHGPLDEPTRTVTFLPNLSTPAVKTSPGATKEVLAPTIAERFFSAVSNYNFPTAAEVAIEEAADANKQTEQTGPSTAPISRLTLMANTPKGGISQRQLQQVKSIMSKGNFIDKGKMNIEINIQMQPPEKRNCCARLCHWEPEVPQARPMYRDDAFYTGKIENLATYKKSVIDTHAEEKTGLEYQLAVSRAVTVNDLKEHRGVFTTAVRRVLATMMDPALLKQCSFLLLCCNGCLMYCGLLVPYVYLADRNLSNGISPDHCSLFVSVIGLSSAGGRLFFCWLADKISPVTIVIATCGLTGLCTMLSPFLPDIYSQYSYSFLFGFFSAGMTSPRSLVIVSLFGLEKLTNGTGMILMFVGIGNLVSTPLAGVIKNQFGYDIAFYVSGAFMTISALVVIPVLFMKKTHSTEPVTSDPTKNQKNNAKTQIEQDKVAQHGKSNENRQINIKANENLQIENDKLSEKKTNGK